MPRHKPNRKQWVRRWDRRSRGGPLRWLRETTHAVLDGGTDRGLCALLIARGWHLEAVEDGAIFLASPETPRERLQGWALSAARASVARSLGLW